MRQSRHHRLTEKASVSEGIYDSYSKTCRRWDLSRDQQVALLGHPGDFTGQRIPNGQLVPQSPDQRDRAQYIVGISLGLGILFEENIAAEVDWLNQPRASLGNKSPLDYMLEGHMTNLLTIVEMVKRERGI